MNNYFDKFIRVFLVFVHYYQKSGSKFLQLNNDNNYIKGKRHSRFFIGIN